MKETHIPKYPRWSAPLAASLALATSALLGETAKADALYTSDVFTVRFVIEEDWSGMTQLDNAHVDVQVGFPGLSSPFNPTLNFGHNPDSTSDGIVYGLDEAYIYGNESTGHILDSSQLASYYAFTGVQEGGMLWNLEQSFTNGMVYAGFNTKNTDTTDMVAWNPEDPSKFANSMNTWIKLELVEVRGPGSVSIYLYDAFGGAANVYMASFDGIGPGDSIYFNPNAHNHFNWAFSSEGLYEVDFRISTMVIPEPATAALIGGGLIFAYFGMRKKSKSKNKLS